MICFLVRNWWAPYRKVYTSLFYCLVSRAFFCTGNQNRTDCITSTGDQKWKIAESVGGLKEGPAQNLAICWPWSSPTDKLKHKQTLMDRLIAVTLASVNVYSPFPSLEKDIQSWHPWKLKVLALIRPLQDLNQHPEGHAITLEQLTGPFCKRSTKNQRRLHVQCILHDGQQDASAEQHKIWQQKQYRKKF